MNEILDQNLKALLQGRLEESGAEYRAAEERSLLTANRITGSRVRSTKTRRVRLSIALACAAVLAVSGVAVAAGVIPSPFKDNVAENVPSLRDPHATKLTAADYARISKGVQSLTTMVPGHPATASEGMHVDKGVVLIDSPTNGRLIAVASSKGDVCFDYVYDGTDEGTGCTDTMYPTGVIWDLHMSGPERQMYGLVTSDISSITIHGSDGRDYPATVANNAFAWATKSGVWPSTITVVRAGVSHTYTQSTLTGAK